MSGSSHRLIAYPRGHELHVFICPNCHRQLQRAPGPHGVYWGCPTCGGRAVGVGLLRRTVAKEPVDRLWHSVRGGAGSPSRPCPSCERRMVEVATSSNGTGVKLDVCRACYFVWFDPTEFERLPQLQQPAPEPELPEKAREALAIAKAQAIAQQAQPTPGEEAPDEFWKYLPAILGMPVEYDQPSFGQIPWMTWAITAFIVAFSIRAFSNLEQAVLNYGLIPAQAWRHGGLTFLTSFLLHGGYFHLIGNMYFLLVFGDNVEDYIGKWRFLLLILLAALVGDVAHITWDPRPEIPVIGASGGISGIIVFYALKYPRAKLGYLFRVMVYFRWIRMPAYVMLIFWVVTQLLGAAQQIAGATNVSSLVHLGGAAVGFAFWLTYRKM